MDLRPTLQELINRIQTTISSRLGIALPFKKASILSALTFALAGGFHLLYGRIEYIVSQFSKPTGTFLELFSFIFGVKRILPTSSSATIKVTGKAAQTVQKGSILSRPDGQTYLVSADPTVDADKNTTAKITAQTPGVAASIKIDDVFTFMEATPDIDATAKVAEKTAIQSGFDLENDDQLRARLYSTLRHPGQGGTANDYKAWAKSNAGVGNVWVSTKDGNLEVSTSFLTNVVDSPIPTAEDVERIRLYIAARKPLGTRIHVFAPTPKAVPVELLIQTDMQKLIPTIEAELKRYFLTQTEPGKRLSVYALSQVISKITRTGNFQIIAPHDDVLTKPEEAVTFGGLTCQISNTF